MRPNPLKCYTAVIKKINDFDNEMKNPLQLRLGSGLQNKAVRSLLERSPFENSIPALNPRVSSISDIYSSRLGANPNRLPLGLNISYR